MEIDLQHALCQPVEGDLHIALRLSFAPLHHLNARVV
jgi:hypothetical protein